MYAFRKPFTAAAFTDAYAWGGAFKPVAVASQVLGYTAAKFIGIKAIAELEPRRRVSTLLALLASAQLALVGFGFTPEPWNIVWLFVNGLSLGLVFGLVLGFLEGRRHTEALAAGLCTSFIVADGVMKTVGAGVLQAGVSEFWMPAASGFLFVIPLTLFAWMLTKIPPPTTTDIELRSQRLPMSADERQAFFSRYRFGLTMVVIMFTLVTILRSVRSDFAPEIWAGLGATAPPSVFAQTEIVVAVCVLILNGSAVLIISNQRAFFFAMALAVLGSLLVLMVPVFYRAGLSPFWFMVLQGLGLYLPYIAVHTTIFERLIAMTRDRGNIGYLMYLADACGYLGYIAVLVLRNIFQPNSDFLQFYERLSVAIAAACILTLIPCWRYFAARSAVRRAGSTVINVAMPTNDGYVEAESQV